MKDRKKEHHGKETEVTFPTKIIKFNSFKLDFLRILFYSFKFKLLPNTKKKYSQTIHHSPLMSHWKTGSLAAKE